LKNERTVTMYDVLFCNVKNTINNGDCSVRFFIVLFIDWYICIYTFSNCCSNHSKELVSSGVRVTRSLVLCVCFVDRCLSFCLFVFLFLAIVLSVLLRYTDSDYPFGIFKLFFKDLISNYSYCIQMYYLFCNIRFLIATVITIENTCTKYLATVIFNIITNNISQMT